MYSITVISSRSFYRRDNLDTFNLLTEYHNWADNNFNAYSSFFVESDDKNQPEHFYKKSDGTIEQINFD